MNLFSGIDKKTLSYFSLFFVVFVWGLAPMVTLELYKYYSPTVRVAFSELVLLVAYLAVSGKNIKSFDLSYLKVGIPTGIFLALANISQKIGLMYTTPAKYAFLENLTCVSVPVLMFILIKKRPSFMTVLSSITCLISVIVLNGFSKSDGLNWGIGEILCAAAGILYGFNIAFTSVYAGEFHPPLYLAVQSAVSVVIAGISTLVFDNLSINGGASVIEPVVFSLKIEHIIFVIISALVISAFCWIIRTEAMKYVDATAVAIIMPFSAVVTSVISIITGNDSLNLNIVSGGILGMLAIFMSTYTDIFRRRGDNEAFCKESLKIRIRNYIKQGKSRRK